jgi:hypothetical protein
MGSSTAPPQVSTAVVPALHCASLPSADLHQQNQGRARRYEV